MRSALAAIVLLVGLSGCHHTVEVRAPEPITINLNIKIEHEIRIKVDKELDHVFEENSDIF